MIDSFSGEYSFLSNFWLCPIPMKGLIYPSTENAYQASKVDEPLRLMFQGCTPAKAKELGNQYRSCENWNDMKFTVMRNVLIEKFKQGSFLAEKLLATGDHELIEGNTWGDVYWGVCEGEGKNNLGKLLMMVRDDLNLKIKHCR